MTRRPGVAVASLVVGLGVLGASASYRSGMASEGEAGSTATVVYPSGGSFRERLAAKEVRRYVYCTTGELLPVSGVRTLPAGGDVILVAEDGDGLVGDLRDSIGARAPPGGYLLKSIDAGGRKVTVIAGSDGPATLNGAYRFAEHLGVRFQLHGDIVPDARTEWALPGLDEVSEPVFATRGILPFHNFPQGPDGWNTDDYIAVVSQLAKMGMNFIGLHWYPLHDHGEKAEKVGPEPTVWIGLPRDVADDGRVEFSYPAYYAHTGRPGLRWGFEPLKTSTFHGGTARLFARDWYGPDVMGDVQGPPSSHGVFERTGAMLREAFTHARRLGVKTCLGTEMPLGFEPEGIEVPEDWVRGMPPALQQRIRRLGKDPADPGVLEEVYRGVFQRIRKTHPLDYYWLWTYERWGAFGLQPSQLEAVKSEMRLVHEVLEETGAPFELATCGWRIGTPDDPDAFDDVLPADVPFAGLWDEAEGFEELRAERVKWPGTWLEEDWGLVQPQLELTRLYADVRAAWDKECHGMLAKHWRTRIVGPNIGALRDLLWFRGTTGSGPERELPPERDAWIEGFYLDWARSAFGREAAPGIAEIFAELDQAGESGPGSLPRPTGWDGGPSAVVASEDPWAEQRERYEFVDELAALRPRIDGAGNLARFDYWLHSFESLRVMGEFGWKRRQLERAMGRERYDAALERRIEMARLWEELMSLQVRRLTNSSELGEIANLEQLTWHSLVVGECDEELAEGLGRRLPPEARPSKDSTGPARLVVTPRRTHLYRGEALVAKAIAVGDVESPRLHWRPWGQGRFRSRPLTHVARGVYRVALPAQERDFEYYVEARTESGKVVFPPAAPRISQTVVVAGTE